MLTAQECVDMSELSNEAIRAIAEYGRADRHGETELVLSRSVKRPLPAERGLQHFLFGER